MTRYLLLFDSYGLDLWGALSDERTGLSFVQAAGPWQLSLSRDRVPWYSRQHFTVSDLRLPFLSPPTSRRKVTTSELVSVITPRLEPRRKQRLFLVILQSFSLELVYLRRSYPVTAAYTCLLKICCLAANVALFFVSRSLPSNGSTRYNIINKPWRYKCHVIITLRDPINSVRDQSKSRKSCASNIHFFPLALQPQWA
jgi:hypothetical protein